MKFEFETNWEACAILPAVEIAMIKCDNCDEPHGVVVRVGWLFWSLYLMSRPEQ